MEITETTTETTQPYPAENNPAPAEASPAWAMLLAGLTAMILIYIVAVFLPKIAAAVDKLLGRENKDATPQNAEEYKVRDIYEGEDGEDK